MKILKTNILLLVLLSLSNCQSRKPAQQEHLYLWETTEDKDIILTSTSMEREFNPSTQSFVQYLELADEFSVDRRVIIFNNISKGEIKKKGFRILQDGNSYKFEGCLVIDNIKDNPSYSDEEIDKNEIAYYPIALIGGGDKLVQRLYFRQDTPTHPIDVLSINTADDTTFFQYTFISPPEYAFLPERDRHDYK